MATAPSSKQQHPLEMTTVTRDSDELEGTLLPPVAVPVSEHSNHQCATAAVPVTAFVYEQEEEETANVEIPTAEHVPLYPEQSQRQEQQAIFAKAKRQGKIEAEVERQEISKASREQYAKAYHASQKVQVANQEARRRNAEGVQVTQDRYTTAESARMNDKKQTKQKQEELAFQSSYKNGYQVKEYETTEYHASDDYEVSEYKSVYDS